MNDDINERVDSTIRSRIWWIAANVAQSIASRQHAMPGMRNAESVRAMTTRQIVKWASDHLPMAAA